ncbi:MAG TPA: hypothetical protein VF959_03515, partial [Casimicrobiaceae bacterium]
MSARDPDGRPPEAREDTVAWESPPADRDGTRHLAGIADALLVFFPALGIARRFGLPLVGDSGELMSASARAGFEPFTNYLQFALCAILVWVAFWQGFRRGRPIVAWIAASVKKPAATSRRWRLAGWLLAVTLLGLYL